MAYGVHTITVGTDLKGFKRTQWNRRWTRQNQSKVVRDGTKDMWTRVGLATVDQLVKLWQISLPTSSLAN